MRSDDLHVDHATPQTRHQCLRVPAENVHDKRPGHTGEYRPGIVGNLGAGLGRDEGGEGVHARLDGEFAERQHRARENVDDNLVLVSIATGTGFDFVAAKTMRIHCLALFSQSIPSGDSYLLANAPRLPAEDCIPAQQTGKEAVVSAFLPGACGIDAPEEDHGGFIDDGERGEIPSVLARCFQDELELFPEPMRCIR